MFDKVYDFLAKIFYYVLYHFILKKYEDLPTNDGLRKKNIQSFLEHRNISDYLNVNTIIPIENSDDYYYILKDHKLGAVLRVYPQTYMGDDFENNMRIFLKLIDGIDIVTFNCFASQNIIGQIKEYRAEHKSDANIRNINMLNKIIDSRAKMYEKGARQSLFPRLDFTLREYVNTVSIIFSEDVTIKDVGMKIESIKANLSSMYPESVSPELFIAIQREFFFQGKDVDFWNNADDTYASVASQITRGGLSINVDDAEHQNGFVITNRKEEDEGDDNESRDVKTFVTVLTTKKFPRTLDANQRDGCFIDRMGIGVQPHLRGPYFTSLVLDMRNNDEIKKRAMSKAQTNLSVTSKNSTRTMVAHPEFAERKEESKEVIDILTHGRERPIPGQWTLVVYDTDRLRLNRSVSSIKTSFSNVGWELVPETFGHVALFSALHSLPLQLNNIIIEFTKRFHLLFDASNHVPIIPFVGEMKGYSARKHILQFGRSGQVQSFDPMDSAEGFNIAASGTTGAGKSYTVNDIVVHSLASWYLVRIIDSLPSYKKAANALGGQYEDFAGKAPCFNFFTHVRQKYENGLPVYYIGKDNIKYPAISDEDYSTIIPMLGLMCNLDIISTKSESFDTNTNALKTAYMAGVFEEAIRASFESYLNEAGMREIYQNIIRIYKKEKDQGNEEQAGWLNSAVTSLARYGEPGGSMYNNFNGRNSVTLNSDYSVFELTELEKKGPLYYLALMSLANQISNEFFDIQNSIRPKILVIEEFWKYIDIPVVLNFSIELARKVRKAGGIFMPVTQGIEDYYANDKMMAIINNCAWRLILKNKNEALDAAVNNGRLSIGAFAKTLLKSIQTRKGYYGEYAIMNNGALIISRYKTDGISHYLFSTDHNDEKLIRNTSEKLGISYQDAILFLGVKKDNPDMDTDAILAEAGLLEKSEVEKKKEQKNEYKKELEEGLKKANALSNFIVEQRHLFDRDGNIKLRLIDFLITNNYNERIDFNHYAKLMQSLEIDAELSIKMIDKVLLSENSKINRLDLQPISVGMSVLLKTLMDNNFYTYLKGSWTAKRYEHITLFIDMDTMPELNYEEKETHAQKEEFLENLIFSVDRFRELGFKIAITNFNISNDNETIKALAPIMGLINNKPTRQNLLLDTRLLSVFVETVGVINMDKEHTDILSGIDNILLDVDLTEGLEIKSVVNEQIDMIDSEIGNFAKIDEINIPNI